MTDARDLVAIQRNNDQRRDYWRAVWAFMQGERETHPAGRSCGATSYVTPLEGPEWMCPWHDVGVAFLDVESMISLGCYDA